jgi:ferredoxin-NADP reductase
MSPIASEFKSGPLTATLASRTSLGAGVVDLVFTLREPERLQFQAGQFVSIQINEPGAGALKRSYSIASPCHAGEQLRFVIRTIPDGAATDFLLTLPVGSEVRMTGPHGFFVLDPQHPGDIIFGATGTGLAAVLPMLGEMATRPVTGRRLLFWGARHQEDLFARDEVAELCRKASTELHEVLSAPPADWKGDKGRITQALVELLPTLKEPTFYLVGNGAMIGDVKRELVARGVDRKRQIRTEAFFD